MGTGPFAVPTCERLLAAGHDIPLVVTRPLILAKGQKKAPPRPVYQWAQEHQLPIFEPDSINSAESIAELSRHASELFFVCDYGQILSRECLSAARLGGINLHGSLLPRHRGAAPVQWALLRGDTHTGVTVIHMTPRLDAGPALAVAKLEIDSDESAAELEPRLAELGVQASLDAVRRLEQWNGESEIGELQDQSRVTKAPRFRKADGQLDCRLPAEYLCRLVRACQPWPGTFANLERNGGGRSRSKTVRIMVRAARTVSEQAEFIPEDWRHRVRDMTLGGVAQLRTSDWGLDWAEPWDEVLLVRTGQGLLMIGRLQPAGKAEMSAKSYLRGHPCGGGEAFQLPDPPLQPLA